MIAIADSQFNEFFFQIETAQNFHQCFYILTEWAKKLGFDDVLYTYTPFVINAQPIIVTSPCYGDSYLQYYHDKNLAQYDHIVQAVMQGEDRIFNWFDEREQHCLHGDSLAVLATTRRFGIRNGVSIPTLLTKHVFAGASFICKKDDAFFHEVCLPNLPTLEIYTKIFHNKVFAKKYYQGVFLTPFLHQLTPAKRAILKGLSQGKSTDEIASELDMSRSYLGNLAGKIRDDFGDVSRERMMYLMGVLELDEII